LALSLLISSLLIAQSSAEPADKAPSRQAQSRIADSVRKEIVTLPTYGVFDWITFSVNGYNVVLSGFASRPTLKTSAERVAKNVEGVSAVDNRIETLPLSPNDDRVRTQAYIRIYGDSNMSRYNPNRGAPIFVSPARMASGLTNDPPVGNHPIHIVVRNGNIALYGTVLNEADKTQVGMLANQVTGAFSVENHLTVEKGRKDSAPSPPRSER
jgi:osmotically-inducible protein OsmY